MEKLIIIGIIFSFLSKKKKGLDKTNLGYIIEQLNSSLNKMGLVEGRKANIDNQSKTTKVGYKVTEKSISYESALTMYKAGIISKKELRDTKK